MADVIIAAIFIYLIYRFLTGFLLPVYKTTRHVKQQFSEMNERRQPGSGPQAPPPAEKPAKPVPKAGEYIEFEEVK